MNKTTEIIMPNVVLTCLTTDKFKTACLSINLLTQLSRETASKNALIPKVLRRGTASLPDMVSISNRLDSLYGARISPIIRKKGEVQVIGFFSDFVDDSLVPGHGNIMEQITALMGEMLLRPNTHGGLLRREYVESEREKLLEKIRSRINDKRAYSMERLMAEMCAMEDYACPKLGHESEAETISHTSLTRHYHELLALSPIEIFYCGSASLGSVKSALLLALSGLPRTNEDPDIGTEIRMNSLEAQPRYFQEQLQVTQAKLAIGFRLGDCMEEPDTAAIRVFNAVFGGCVTSKLFANVREKLSLCYFASSTADLHKGILAVSSGIEFNKYDAALNEIFAQLDEIRNGNLSDNELSGAKRALAGDYRSIEDSPAALEEYYLNQALIGPDCSPAALAALTEDVSAQQVVAIAQGVECDAVYLLHGEGESV